MQNVHSLQFEVLPISKAETLNGRQKIRASLQAKGTPIGGIVTLIVLGRKGPQHPGHRRETDDRKDAGDAQPCQEHPYKFSHNWLGRYDSKVGKWDSQNACSA